MANKMTFLGDEGTTQGFNHNIRKPANIALSNIVMAT